MTETSRMETLLTTRHYKATSSFFGVAESVQRARYTAGGLWQANESLAADALFVPGKGFASATLWQLFVLMLLLILTLNRMVLVLRK